MKHLASLALLFTFAAAQVAFAEDERAQAPQQKVQKHHVSNPGLAVHNGPQVHRNFNPNLQHNYSGVHNPNIHAQPIHNTGAINSKVVNVHNRNVTNVNGLNYNANNFKGKQNWHAGDAKFQPNHARWEHYRTFERHRHDRDWWTHRYSRFAVFGGGYYYWNNGFWYPAYGYDPYFSTYSYDAPIYAHNDQDPGQVIADVQNALSQAGYEPGPVDGTYGPATREALLRYQSDNGLRQSGEIDEGTLDSLGLQ